MHDGLVPHDILRKPITALFVLVLLSCVVLGSTGTGVLNVHKAADIASSDQKAVLYSLEGAFSSIAQRVEPAVVSITAIQHASQQKSLKSGEGAYIGRHNRSFHLQQSSDLLQQLFPLERSDAPIKASGSGTIVRRSGDMYYILTNYHVVEDTYQVTVQLSDKSELKGIVIGTDPATDLAVVRIASTKLSDRNIVKMGDSNSVKVGDWALAVGSPYGFEQTLTVGVVSALHRELSEEDANYPDLIQTDAAINKGNSGGPLLDVEGQVVGVNAAIASPTGGSIGLGFAIPVNVAKSVLDDLVSNGRVVRGWIGIGIQEMTPVLKEYYSTDSGVMVASIDEDSPASKAGIQGEDIVIEYRGNEISEVRQLQKLVSDSAPGSLVSMVVVRKGQPQTIQVSVGISPLTPAGRPSPPKHVEDAGIRVRTLPDPLAHDIGLSGTTGVIVLRVQVGSAADDADLQEGDIVIRFNGHQVLDDGDFARKMKSVSQHGVVVLKVFRKGSMRIVGFRNE